MSNEKEREKLIVENMKLVYLVINNLHLQKQLEELVDLGMIGLCKGVDSFKPQKGYALSTYLYRCISNEILQYFRKKRPTCVSLDNVIEDEITGYDVIQDEDINIEEDYFAQEQKEIMYKYINRLTQQEQLIINKLFGLNGHSQMTQTRLALILGTTQAQISRIKDEIIVKLQIMVMEEKEK